MTLKSLVTRDVAMKNLSGPVGIFAVGHDTYWDQFDGLLDELMGYHGKFKAKVEANGVTVHDFGMVDTAASAYEALKRIKATDLDLVFAERDRSFLDREAVVDPFQ